MWVNNALIPWNVFESGVSVLIQNEKDWEVFVKLETSAQYMTYIYIYEQFLDGYVYEHMSFQCSFLCELFVADRTLERFFTGVYSLVHT